MANSRKKVSKTKLKLNKNSKPKNNAAPKSAEDADDTSEDSTLAMDLEDIDSRTEALEEELKTERKFANNFPHKYKDLADIPGLFIVRGGFNSGFDMIAKTTGDPIRVRISGDNLPGTRNDSHQFGVRLGNKKTQLPGKTPLNISRKIKNKGQIYNEEEIAMAIAGDKDKDKEGKAGDKEKK